MSNLECCWSDKCSNYETHCYNCKQELSKCFHTRYKINDPKPNCFSLKGIGYVAKYEIGIRTDGNDMQIRKKQLEEMGFIVLNSSLTSEKVLIGPEEKKMFGGGYPWN